MDIAKSVARLVAGCCAIFAVAACATPAISSQASYPSEQSDYLPAIGSGENYTGANYEASRGSSYKSSGDVHVKGYTRKDGTYVRPHTRSRSRR